MNQEEFSKGFTLLAKFFNDLAVQTNRKREEQEVKKLFKAQLIKRKKHMMNFISF